MAMPETTVHENHFMQLADDDIRPTGNVHGMETITVSETCEGFADGELRSCVFALNQTHLTAALRRREWV